MLGTSLGRSLGTPLLGTSSKALPQLGIPDAENKVFSAENPEVTIKLSPFKAWSKSEYNHALVTHCQEFLPCPDFDLRSAFTFIFPNPLTTFYCVIANKVSRAGQQNKIGNLAHSHKRFKQVLVVSAYGINRYHSLPQDLRHCSTLSSFKAKLKTFLFSQYFRPN